MNHIKASPYKDQRFNGIDSPDNTENDMDRNDTLRFWGSGICDVPRMRA